MPLIMATHDEDSLVESRKAFGRQNPTLTFDITLLRKRWLASLAVEFGYSAASADEGFQVFWEARNAVVLYDGVTELLQRLGSRFHIGAITNGNADVHFIGIGHLFDYVVTAADAKAAKPAPAIFHLAESLAGRPLNNTLHVGDDPVRDVLGASALGMKTAWINPQTQPWPGGQVPDLVLRSVTDLESALARLSL
jgi:putative hydrolase of the HAD superfamily